MGRCRRPVVLWPKPKWDVPAGRRVRRPDRARRQAIRFADRAAYEIRVRPQPQDRNSDRYSDPHRAPAACRRGDRVSEGARQSWRDPAGASPTPGKGQRPAGSECCVATGGSGCEAYTAIAWGVGLSHERSDIAGAEGFHSLEGNMCGIAMRGAVALLGSKATSRAKGSHPADELIQ